MYRARIQVRNIDGRFDELFVYFKHSRECIDYINEFPKDIVVDWDICPVDVKPPIYKSKDVNCMRMTLSFQPKDPKDKLPSINNITVDCLPDVLRELSYDNIYSMRLYPRFD